MVGKFIALVLILIVVIGFISLNLEYKTDLRVWFGERGLLVEVPVFLVVFGSFLLGVLAMIPLLARQYFHTLGMVRDRRREDRMRRREEKTRRREAGRKGDSVVADES